MPPSDMVTVKGAAAEESVAAEQVPPMNLQQLPEQQDQDDSTVPQNVKRRKLRTVDPQWDSPS